MANKMIRDGEFLRDRHGGVFTSLGRDEERNKCYAVIVRCGHCGEGFYIPIMFTTRSGSVRNAIEDIKMTPRVKREKSDCVLDAFEISELEKFIVDAINDHDDYLKGYVAKDTWKMEDRRISAYWDDETEIRTADDYHYYDVLARTFAPRYVGSELIVPTRINRKELLQEFFKCAAVRYGFKREDPFFPMLYYMQYGEENDLGIKFDGKIVSYKFKSEDFEFPIKENMLKYVERYGIKETEKKREYFSENLDEIKLPSRIDKFNARLERFRKMSGREQSEIKPGETEPGE